MLTDFILRCARERSFEQRLDSPTTAETLPFLTNDASRKSGEDTELNTWDISAGEVEFIIGTPKHKIRLEHFLERVESYCTIVSPVKYGANLERIFLAIRKAIERGVSVSVLWSRTLGGDEKALFREAGLVSRKAIEKNGDNTNRGSIVLNDISIESNACVVFGDLDGAPCAIVGNYGWLGEADDERVGSPASCETTSEGVIGALTLGLTELYQVDKRTADCADAIRLRNVGEKMRQRSARKRRWGAEAFDLNAGKIRDLPDDGREADSRVSIVFGMQHIAVVSRDCASARSSVQLAVREFEEDKLVSSCLELRNAIEDVGVNIVLQMGKEEGEHVDRVIQTVESVLGEFCEHRVQNGRGWWLFDYRQKLGAAVQRKVVSE